MEIFFSYFLGLFGLELASLASIGLVRLADLSLTPPSDGTWSFVAGVAGVVVLVSAAAKPPDLKSARRAGFGSSLKILILYRMMPRMRSSTNFGSHIASSYYNSRLDSSMTFNTLYYYLLYRS